MHVSRDLCATFSLLSLHRRCRRRPLRAAAAPGARRRPAAAGLQTSELYGKFTWRLDKFGECGKRELRSNVFEVGSFKWCVPRGMCRPKIAACCLHALRLPSCACAAVAFAPSAAAQAVAVAAAAAAAWAAAPREQTAAAAAAAAAALHLLCTPPHRSSPSHPALLPGCRRYLLVYPHGCDVANHLSLFLCVADYDKLLPGWSHFAQVRLCCCGTSARLCTTIDGLPGASAGFRGLRRACSCLLVQLADGTAWCPLPVAAAAAPCCRPLLCCCPLLPLMPCLSAAPQFTIAEVNQNPPAVLLDCCYSLALLPCSSPLRW